MTQDAISSPSSARLSDSSVSLMSNVSVSDADAVDYTHMVRSLMQQADIASFGGLAKRAGVSEWQVRQLRQGHVAQMRLEALLRLSGALGISLTKLVNCCSAIALLQQPPSFSDSDTVQETQNTQDADCIGDTSPNLTDSQSGITSTNQVGLSASSELSTSAQPLSETLEGFKSEYARLQAQLVEQRDRVLHEFQRTSIQTLESWMMYWPAATYAANNNPELPATRLIPLVRPVEKLLRQWGVEAIASVGVEVAFNPQQHQLIDGTAKPGDPVCIRNPGYLHEGALLYRAKVKGK